MEHTVLEQENLHFFAVPRGQISKRERIPTQKRGLLSKLFSQKNFNKAKRARSPLVKNMQVRKLSPKRAEQVYMVTEGDEMHHSPTQLPKEDVRCESAKYCNDAYYHLSQGDNVLLTNQEVDNSCRNLEVIKGRLHEIDQKEKVIEQIRKKKTYLQVVQVVNQGTDPCIQEMSGDKSTDPLIPGDDECFDWEKHKDEFVKSVHKNEMEIKSCLEEGNLLIQDLQKLQDHMSDNIKNSKPMKELFNGNDKTPTDFLRLSRQCLIHLGFLMLNEEKRHESEVQKLNFKVDTEKKRINDMEIIIENLNKKIDKEKTNLDREAEKLQQLESKNKSLQESLEIGKRALKENENLIKVKVEKLECDVFTQRQLNSKLFEDLKDKADLVTQLKSHVEKLRNNLATTKQEMKDMQCSFKETIAKLEMEHTNKMSAMCETQTLTNKQLTHALNQSSHFTNQMQEFKKENISLVSKNKSLNEKVENMERELKKAQDRSSVAERRLSRETQEVLSLKDQLNRIDSAKEEELLCIDGDIWCQIMYQQDQAILNDLRASLLEKENSLDSLRAQGDCSLKDFEQVQCELQQRRIQFNELKEVFLEYEKRRESLVREQREFYSKMLIWHRSTISREKFFKSLIDEVQSKSKTIEELVLKLNDANKSTEEANETSEANFKAMQTEIKFTAEKLYELENQIRLKNIQLQDVISAFEHERQNKVSAEEVVVTLKPQLETLKKENCELRNKLSYFKDIEKNRTSMLKEVELIAKETQTKHDTENKLRKLEKELTELKTKLDSKEDLVPHSDNKSKNIREVDYLKKKIQDLTDTKKYVERILLESQRSKEALQKDHEDLCGKMRYAVKVMVESKKNQEALELKLDERRHLIHDLQKSQADTEDRLDDLRDVLHEMKHTIDLLQTDREDLKDKLLNHSSCKAERILNQELKLLQRDKSITEDQHSREKEMLLRRVKENEDIMRDQHKHLRALQEQLDDQSIQLKDAKNQLATERHNHTQQLLSLQADKKKLEMYVKELEGRMAIETRLKMQTSDSLLSSPKFLSSDSYEPPIKDYAKSFFYKK